MVTLYSHLLVHVATFLNFLNGDWRRDKFWHHCVPGQCSCGSEEEARRNAFAALMRISATLGSSTDLHCARRWTTTTDWAGDVGLGVLRHGLLPQCLLKAFATWDVGTPPLEVVATEDYRAQCKSKVWRCGRISRSESRKQHICWADYLSEPLDRLLAQLQYIGEQGNAFWTRRTHPLAQSVSVSVKVANTLEDHDWHERLLGIVLDGFDHGQDVIFEAVNMLASSAVQLHWR